MNTIKVTLRERPISKGRLSLYLDYYPALIDRNTGKKSRREFLKMYLFEKPKNVFDKQHNKEVRALAQNIRAQRQIDLQKSKFGFMSSTKKKFNFLEYFEGIIKTKYQSLGNYGNWKSVFKHLKDFRPHGVIMEEVDRDFVRDFKSFLDQKNNLKQNSKVSYFAKLKASLKLAVHDGYLEENPSEGIKGPKPEDTKREFLTIEEIKALMKTDCKTQLIKQAFLFSALCGLRFSDLKNLKWNEIESGPNSIYIRFKQKKTGRQETLPISTDAFSIISEEKERSGYVFKYLKYASYYTKNLKLWIKEAGIDKKISFHNARHTFATLVLTKGNDIYTLSKLLGHQQVKTTAIYGNVIDQRKVDAVNTTNILNLKEDKSI